MYDDYYTENLGAMHESLIDELEEEFSEYKNAMEYYFGRGRCLEALEQYRNEVIKTER